MIYLVVPDGVDTADDFTLWSSSLAFVPAYATMEDAAASAKERARVDGVPYMVRKLSTVSFHP